MKAIWNTLIQAGIDILKTGLLDEIEEISEAAHDTFDARQFVILTIERKSGTCIVENSEGDIVYRDDEITPRSSKPNNDDGGNDASMWSSPRPNSASYAAALSWAQERGYTSREEALENAYENAVHGEAFSDNYKILVFSKKTRKQKEAKT